MSAHVVAGRVVDSTGRPFDWRVTLAGTGAGHRSYLAGSVEWQHGALILTRAADEGGNPNGRPADRLIIPLQMPALAVIDYIGPPE